MALLELQEVVLKYAEAMALNGISLQIEKGECVALLGGNGAGKSSIVNAVCGIEPITEGTIRFDHQTINGLPPHEIVRRGIVQIPEGRLVFPKMTVWENLELGGTVLRDKNRKRELREKIYAYFPLLKERQRQLAGTLSGGEQQILAVGRALMSNPRLILCDEISMGLAPLAAHEIYQVLKTVYADWGVTLLIVEQDMKLALRVANFCYLLETGRIAGSGSSEEMQRSDMVRKVYLGES